MSFEKTNRNKIKVQNGELYLERNGKGKPLVLVHAGFSDRRDWNHQIEDFAEEYNTIIYDQRGCGNSTSIEDEKFSPAADLKAIVDDSQLEKIFLVGHSIGGTISLDFTLQYPEKVSALVLIASGINGYVWSHEYIQFMSTIWSAPKPEEMAKKFLSAPFYEVSMKNQNIRSEIEKITVECFQKVLTWKTFDPNIVHWFFPEAISKLKEIKIPTLIIYGDQDSEDIKKIADLLKHNIQASKTSIIKNADHLLNFEKPKELNKEILDFLSNQN